MSVTSLTSTSSQLLPDNALSISEKSPLVLGVNDDPGAFRNPVFCLRLDREGVEVAKSREETNSFEMNDQRNNTSLNLADSPETVLGRLGDVNMLPLSNIGVSLAVTLRGFEGRDWAVMQLRSHDQRYMLISGYVDAAKFINQELSSRALVAANTYAEAGEEILAIKKPGKTHMLHVLGALAQQIASEVVLFDGSEALRGNGDIVEGLSVGRAYGALSYDEQPILLRHSSMPAYIQNIHPVRNISLDALPFSAGFQYAQQWNAGQFVLPFTLVLPKDQNSLFLYHAEDKFRMVEAADGKKCPQLATMLNREGLVLIELDHNERLTDNISRLINGNLIPVEDGDPMQRKFSEAFAPSPISGVTGFVNQPDVMRREMV